MVPTTSAVGGDSMAGIIAPSSAKSMVEEWRKSEVQQESWQYHRS